jgi:hypothetical protein
MSLTKRIDYPHVWVTGLGLFTYCIIITFITGDIGFEGDDWWVFNVPYWHAFPDSLLVYAKQFLRPIEGVYWITMFEIFGFNRIVFHFFSLSLLAAGSFLMGISLSRSFPQNRVFVILAVLFSFFLPMISSLTYVVFTDNSRLCSLFFWASVLLYLQWGSKDASWVGLVLPGLFYIISFLTYESCSLLIFAVPFLLIPIYSRRAERPPVFSFFMRVGVGILTVFSLAIFLRFAFLNGGAVTHDSLLPPLSLFLSYLGLLPFYLAAPFVSFNNGLWSWLLGFLFAVYITATILYLRRKASNTRTEPSPVRHQTLWLIALGLFIFFLGMLPYQMAGYGTACPTLCETLLTKSGFMPDGSVKWFGFESISRIYSSASYGLSIIFAAILTGWEHSGRRKLFAGISALAIACLVAFHAGLRTDWKEAAEIRNDIVGSLITQVPDVAPGTNFVCLDLECYHKRAAVFRSWVGLQCLLEMLYNRPSVTACYLYSYSWRWPNVKHPGVVVSPEGLWSRGMGITAPQSSLLILKRKDRKLELLKEIKAGDGQIPTGILWQGADSVRSNLKRIVGLSDPSMRLSKIRTDLKTGLISTLKLAKAGFPFRFRAKLAKAIELKSGIKYFRIGPKVILSK